MEFGSVKFFKTVILGTTALLIAVPTALSIGFGVHSALLASDLKEVKASLATAQVQLLEAKDNELKNASAEPPSDPDVPAPVKEASFEYQSLYEDLYTTPPVARREDAKVAYLTFDDGPSVNTPKVLQILEENNIKATFFVTGPSSVKYPEHLKAITDAGHKIAVHTYSHKYDEIYSSVDMYLADFNQMHTIITDATGVNTDIFRFPGGSINNYNRSIYMSIIAEMTRRGYVYFDWNVSSGDVAAGASKSIITKNVLTGSAKQRGSSVILMHDRADTSNTVAALPDIIAGLSEQGYTFDRLENDVKPYSFAYQK